MLAPHHAAASASSAKGNSVMKAHDVRAERVTKPNLGPPPPPPPLDSDIRLKTDISRIGTTIHNLPLYTYRYKAGGGMQIGVMAQDVVEVVPDAVLTRADGHFVVDYGLLGLGDLAACNAASAALTTPIGPPPPPPPVSDIRLKTDITRIGTTLHDLPLYTYRCKAGGGMQVGVMAHDVAGVVPDAVLIRADGYFAVDYSLLGLGDLAACNAASVAAG
jgi:hypothetical protein